MLQQRPPAHYTDGVCFIGGFVLIAAAVPIVVWSVEAIFGLFR